MPIVLPNEGLINLLTWMIKSPISGLLDWQLMLFTNDLHPDQDTVYSDLVEATFYGYSRVPIQRMYWTVPTIIDDRAVSTYTETPQTWTVLGGTETIYGYAMVTPTSPLIEVIERLVEPIPFTTGGVFELLPRLTLTTEQL